MCLCYQKEISVTDERVRKQFCPVTKIHFKMTQWLLGKGDLMNLQSNGLPSSVRVRKKLLQKLHSTKVN